jgi:hypothetical protein
MKHLLYVFVCDVAISFVLPILEATTFFSISWKRTAEQLVHFQLANSSVLHIMSHWQIYLVYGGEYPGPCPIGSAMSQPPICWENHHKLTCMINFLTSATCRRWSYRNTCLQSLESGIIGLLASVLAFALQSHEPII